VAVFNEDTGGSPWDVANFAHGFGAIYLDTSATGTPVAGFKLQNRQTGRTNNYANQGYVTYRDSKPTRAPDNNFNWIWYDPSDDTIQFQRRYDN
jgi:hypothetical protein